jgi:hypothetical protein
VPFLRRLASYPRRSPVTTAFVVLLFAAHFWVDRLLPRDTAAWLLLAVSTNLDNLRHDPIGSLLGSALFFDGTLTNFWSLDFAGTLITLGAGVIVCLAWLERRYGPLRAFGIFAAGHIGATLLTAPFILLAISHGWYPESIRHTYDFGISYGAQAVLAASSLLLRPILRPFAIVGVLAWPLGGADWLNGVPDFSTVGHLLAAAIGFVLYFLILRPKVSRRQEQESL